MKAVIDSDVLIDFLQGIPAARTELACYRRPHCSMISFMEMLAGAHSGGTPGCRGPAREPHLSEPIARRALELRQSLRLKLPDAIVLASADVEGCILVTRNTRDFPSNDPRVRFPYAL